MGKKTELGMKRHYISWHERRDRFLICLFFNCGLLLQKLSSKIMHFFVCVLPFFGEYILPVLYVLSGVYNATLYINRLRVSSK